jgi:hypothetical protein
MKKLLLLFLSVILFTATRAQTPTVGLIDHQPGSLDAGYVLFPPVPSFNTYLIDKCGKEVHSWNSSYKPAMSAYLLEDGTLLRPGRANNNIFTGGGNGGVIEILDWNSNVIWSYMVSDGTQCQHHDVKMLPNGNILVIAWELKTSTQALAAGRNPSLTGNAVWSEKIIELQPIGNDSAAIVWEWHLWDHLIQDFDNTKANFGIVSANPQLVDANFEAANGPDWIHLNSIDYNEDLDQIIVSSHNFSEVWVIDHSTTTAEAASHAGGNSGKGGDLLYRWGNPAAYDQGTASDQKLFAQHNAYWIESSFPYGDQIMIFNNGMGRPGGNYSSIEIINPPVDGAGNYTQSFPYLPSATSWTYADPSPFNFYSQNISGAQQLANGNVLMCDGPAGTFFEIDSLKNIVWEYINPIALSGPISQGTTPSMNTVFRCTYYPSSYSGFAGQTLTPGNPLESNPDNYSCILNSTGIGESEQVLFTIEQDVYGIEIYTVSNEKYRADLYNLQGEMVFTEINCNQVNTTNFANGIYFLSVTTESGKSLTRKIIMVR